MANHRKRIEVGKAIINGQTVELFYQWHAWHVTRRHSNKRLASGGCSLDAATAEKIFATEVCAAISYAA